MDKKLKVYFALLVLLVLLLARPGGRQALPVAAAVVWEAASTMPDPSERHTQRHTPSFAGLQQCVNI